MNDEIVNVGAIEVKTVILKGWEQTLREWYAANAPTSPLQYHYCDKCTMVTAPMAEELFSEIFSKLTGGGILAVKLTMTYGDTVCHPKESFNKKLGRMQAWQNAKMIDMWVREVKIMDGMATLVAYEEMDSYGGNLRIEFTRKLSGGHVRTYIRGLSKHFTRCKSFNEPWYRR